MPGPTLLFIGPFDQLPRKAERETEGRREGGSQKLDVAAAAVKNQRHKTEDRGRETSDFKIDVLTFRPRASIFVQTVVIEGNPREQVRVAT